MSTDYSNTRNTMVIEAMSPYTISFTQDEAGFASTIEEEILYVDMKPNTYSMCKFLQNR